MRMGSVFAGIGGIDLGFERAGWDVAWQCEFDPSCQRVLMRHWPRTRLYDDVKELNRRVEQGDLPEEVDLIAGGFPCQDISLAGGRSGLAGARSGLYFAFMELVAALRPEFVLVENVSGLLSSNGTRDLGAVLGTLEELGYGWAYRTLDSRYFGVPQRRRRVFVVGCAGAATGRAASVLFESEGLPWDPLAGTAAREEAPAPTRNRVTDGRVSRSLNAHPQPRYDGESDTFVTEEVASSLTRSAGHHGHSSPRGDGADNLVIEDEPIYAVRTAQTGSNGWGVREDETGTLDSSGGDAVVQGSMGFAINPEMDTPEEEVASPLRANMNGQGTSAGPNTQAVLQPISMRWREGKPGGGKGALLSDDRALTLAAADDQMLFQPQGFQQNQREEVILSDQASSLTTGGGKPGQGYSAIMDGYVVRRFTPLECERLQGFPEGWTSIDPDGRSIRDDERARMLGNAVTVPVARWIGERMRVVHENG